MELPKREWLFSERVEAAEEITQWFKHKNHTRYDGTILPMTVFNIVTAMADLGMLKVTETGVSTSEPFRPEIG